MKTMTAKTAVKRIVDHAEKIRNDATQQFPVAASVGDSWRQGDVYVTLIDGVPSGMKIDAKPSLQMAPGNTQGSRHCLDSLDGVTVHRLSNPEMLDGPVIVLNRERTLTHPEHGDVILPAGTYQISYQQNLDELERAQRVLD